MSLIQSDDGLRQAAYPLPFGHSLQVRYDRTDGEIKRLVTWAPYINDAPITDGLRVHTTTIDEVFDRLGLDTTEMSTPGFVEFEGASRTLRLYFDVPDNGEAVLVLVFFWPSDAGDIETAQAEFGAVGYALPGEAVLGQVELLDRAYMARLPDVYPPSVLARTMSIPFPIPLDEAFPSLIP